MKHLLNELKRRKVIRAVLAYAVAAFVIIQAADPLVDVLMLPGWTLRLVFALALLGLSAVIGLAWAFDWGPGGLEPADRVTDGGSTEGQADGAGSVSLSAPWRVAVIGAVAVLALAGGAWVLWGGSADDPPRDRIVVLPLDNRTGDPELDPLGRLAADWVTQGIIRGRLGTVLPVKDVLQTLGVPGVDMSTVSATYAGRATGSGTVVEGSFYLLRDSVEIQARVVDVRRGRVLGSVDGVRAPAADPRGAVEAFREQIGGILATLLDPRDIMGTDSLEVSEADPPTLEAYRAYAEGLDHFLRYDYAEAVPLLTRAHALDSTFVRPLVYAAFAFINQGLDSAADSVVDLAESRTGRLSGTDQLWIRAARAQVERDRRTMISTTARLAEIFPNSEWQYIAGFSELYVNRPRRALQHLEAMDPTRGPMARWPDYWWAYRDAYHILGEYEAELRIARRAVGVFPEPERVLWLQREPLAALGRMSELRKLLVEIERLGSGTPGGQLRSSALELRAHGFADSADTFLQEALDWYAAQSSELRERYRAGLAYTLYAAGRLDSARTLYEGMLARSPEPVDERSRDAVIDLRGRLGTIAAGLGETEEAQRVDAWLEGLDWPYLLGENTLWRARIAAGLENPDRAAALLRQAFLEGIPFHTGFHRDPDFVQFRDHPAFRSVLEPGGDP